MGVNATAEGLKLFAEFREKQLDRLVGYKQFERRDVDLEIRMPGYGGQFARIGLNATGDKEYGMIFYVDTTNDLAEKLKEVESHISTIPSMADKNFRKAVRALESAREALRDAGLDTEDSLFASGLTEMMKKLSTNILPRPDEAANDEVPF